MRVSASCIDPTPCSLHSWRACAHRQHNLSQIPHTFLSYVLSSCYGVCQKDAHITVFGWTFPPSGECTQGDEMHVMVVDFSCLALVLGLSACYWAYQPSRHWLKCLFSFQQRADIEEQSGHGEPRGSPARLTFGKKQLPPIPKNVVPITKPTAVGAPAQSANGTHASYGPFYLEYSLLAEL